MTLDFDCEFQVCHFDLSLTLLQGLMFAKKKPSRNGILHKRSLGPLVHAKYQVLYIFREKQYLRVFLGKEAQNWKAKKNK